MSYDIRYGQTIEMKRMKTSPINRHRKAIAAALILIVIITALAWAGRSSWFQDLLIPGDEAVTRAAFGGFVDDIEAGTPMVEAVTVFCREILKGANLS